MSPRTKEQNEEIRNEKRKVIMSAAIRLFSVHGYEATSINMIAKEADIAKGLMYTYFDSKESLLYALIDDYMHRIGDLMNPAADDEITDEELANFLDGLRSSIEADNEYWRLYAQLSMRPDVLALFFERHNSGSVVLKHNMLLKKYFVDRFENADLEEFLFTSMLKGFTIQYAFAPGLFPKEVVDQLIARMKEMYVLPKPKGDEGLFTANVNFAKSHLVKEGNSDVHGQKTGIQP